MVTTRVSANGRVAAALKDLFLFSKAEAKETPFLMPWQKTETVHLHLFLWEPQHRGCQGGGSSPGAEGH